MPKFEFRFGENAHLPENDFNREWLEIYSSDDPDGTDGVTDLLIDAGINLPDGLGEMCECIFDYRFNGVSWNREDLKKELIKSGLIYLEDGCVLSK